MELRPCPCGHYPDAYRDEMARLRYDVECPRCGRRSPGSHTYEGAIESWNTMVGGGDDEAATSRPPD